jgi:hypothetical protein
MSIIPWTRAGAIPESAEARRPELVTLPVGIPDLATLFTFMRDAELRFSALRMRIEEHTWGARGEQVLLHEILLRHPNQAKVTTSEPGLGPRANYELWLTDGASIRTYSGIHRLATTRPVRGTVVGVDNRDLPGFSRVYHALTTLPMESLPETFIHPAGFLQNVLGTGETRILTTAEHLGRETIVVACDHPRVTEVWAEHPDHALELTIDRETGVILRLLETIARDVTRDAIVTAFEPDAPLPPNAFELTVPSDATVLY